MLSVFFIVYSSRESGPFQGLPEAIVIDLPLCLKNFLAGWNVPVLQETTTEDCQVGKQAGCSMVGSLKRY